MIIIKYENIIINYNKSNFQENIYFKLIYYYYFIK